MRRTVLFATAVIALLVTMPVLASAEIYIPIVSRATSPRQPTATATGMPSTVGRILFLSLRDGNQEIYAINSDGSGLANLTKNSARDADPSWSPDGKHIAFISNRDGNDEVYVMNADGSGQTNLTQNPWEDSRPAWSSDGNRITFWSRPDLTGGPRLYLMNADGTGRRLLSSSESSAPSSAWSPTEDYIAFTSDDGCGQSPLYTNQDICVINADGSNLRRLTTSSSSDTDPVWSPDGSKIAYCGATGVAAMGLVVMNNDGSGKTLLINEPAVPILSFAWSPDAVKIAYVLPYTSIGSYSDIFVIRIDGTGKTNLTNLKTADDSPSWSPDSKHIAFTSNRDGNDEIYVMNADGSNQTRLTGDPAGDFGPAWAPQ